MGGVARPWPTSCPSSSHLLGQQAPQIDGPEVIDEVVDLLVLRSDAPYPQSGRGLCPGPGTEQPVRDGGQPLTRPLAHLLQHLLDAR